LNFLAHFYLTDESPASLVGSLMGDFVKGRLTGRYPATIERAIFIHRCIDSFTDSDETVLLSRRRIDPSFRLLRGVLIDVFYDHFLARHWERFSDEPLSAFTRRVYHALDQHGDHFTGSLKTVAVRMAEEDWLSTYQEIDGIGAILRRMARRLSRPNALARGVDALERHYDGFEEDFMEYMPRLVSYVEQLGVTRPLISTSEQA